MEDFRFNFIGKQADVFLEPHIRSGKIELGERSVPAFRINKAGHLPAVHEFGVREMLFQPVYVAFWEEPGYHLSGKDILAWFSGVFGLYL